MRRGQGQESDAGTAMVSVLGQTTVAERPLTARQRAAVAALAFHRDHGIDTERLIDAVWRGHAPSSARPSLQNQISRLRAVFGTDFIITDRGRYRINATTDVDRFESLAGPAVSSPACARLVPDLTAALDLWRGLPYEDLDDLPDIDAERARLAELRRLAEEQAAASQLAGGAIETSLTDLAALVTAEPYRERRWELLMTGLARIGRHAEASDAYHRLEAILTAELGIEPSLELRNLRDAIERRDDIDLLTTSRLFGEDDALACTRGCPRSRPRLLRVHAVKEG